MSLDHPIPSSDDSEGDLHAGFDRELDLAAERPFTGDDAPRGRGPGTWVAAIVVSSLSLAGIISLARGEPEAVADAAEPAPIEPEPAPVEREPAIVAPSIEPMPVAPQPSSRKPPRASIAHAAVVRSALPVPPPVPTSSEDEGSESSAATAGGSSRTVPAADRRDPVVPTETRASGLALPQPAFDEATTEIEPEPEPKPEPKQVAPSRTLPSVDEPSLFDDDDDDADADESVAGISPEASA